MKIPRDLSAKDLVKVLTKLGYSQTRQVGSHLRLSIARKGTSFHITIPNHSSIKIGTLNSILKDVSLQLNISREEIIRILE